MKTAAVRRTPASLYALTALVVLFLSAALALAGAPGHAAPQADDDPSSKVKITSDIVIKSDDTYSLKMVITDATGFGIFNEDNCTADSIAGTKISNKGAKVSFEQDGDSNICTLEGSANIEESKGQIKHEGNEYVVKLDSGDDDSSYLLSNMDITQSVTFPGKVTDAGGGKVDGNKVTFNDIDSHTVKGKDGSSIPVWVKGKDGSIPVWVWILVGVVVVAVIGGGVAAFVIISRRRKKQAQPSLYAAPAQGLDPNQPFPAQPGQQPHGGQPDGNQSYNQPGQQPDGGQPDNQPGQQPYGDQQAQSGYGAPQAQPGQQPHGGQPDGNQSYNQPGQPGQGTY